MFDKIKAYQKAKKLQDNMQKQMEQIFHQHEKGLNTILLRGDKKVEKIVIDGEERKDIKDLINDGIKEVEKKVEKKMKEQAPDVMAMLGL